MRNEVLNLLAKSHKEWVYIARSFGISKTDAEEIVQQMYIDLAESVEDVTKIMYNETEVNKYYVYVSLKNLYYLNWHIQGKKSKKVVTKPATCYSDKFDSQDEFFEFVLGEDETMSTEMLQIKDDALNKIHQAIRNEVDSWHNYNKRVFKIVHDQGVSQRELARETTISLSSIHNTVKNGREKLKEKFGEDYQDYSNGDYEKV